MISTEDEFTTRLPIASSLSKQIPMTLELEVEAVKRRLPASIEYYRTMVTTLDRIQKRSEANAVDYTRFSLAVGYVILLSLSLYSVCVLFSFSLDL